MPYIEDGDYSNDNSTMRFQNTLSSYYAMNCIYYWTYQNDRH